MKHLQCPRWPYLFMEHELGTDPKKWSVFILKQVGREAGLWEGKQVYRGLLGISKNLEPF